MEADLTKKVKKYLESFNDDELWFYKVSDRYTSGIPDYLIGYRGTFIAIELKDAGKRPRKLQRYVISQIIQAGNYAISADNLDAIKRLFHEIDSMNEFLVGHNE